MKMVIRITEFRSLPHLSLLLLLLLVQTGPSLSSGEKHIQCKEKERRALLEIKGEFEDDYDHLSSWSSKQQDRDCCSWRGVRCSKHGGNVVKLDLYVNEVIFRDGHHIWKPLRGKLSPSILKLRHLHYLDLSYNEFSGGAIPNFNESLLKLRYLNLTGTVFGGTLEYQLANLSGLEHLKLSVPIPSSEYQIQYAGGDSISWLWGLSSLRILHLDGINFGRVDDWFQVVNSLTSLTELSLSDCSLSSFVPRQNSSSSLKVKGLSSDRLADSMERWPMKFQTNITYLDLSYNILDGSIPEFLGYMESLAYLDLSQNMFEGGIPGSFGKLCNLRSLYLRGNNLDASLPHLIRNISGCLEKSLELLDLANNQIHGSLPDIGGGLSSQLEVLDLSRNSLQGVVSEAHVGNLSKLRTLDLSGNLLSLKFDSDYAPPFHLEVIRLSGCDLGPEFPKWLRTQGGCSFLDISNAKISDSVPLWFWDVFSVGLTYMNLSSNGLHGQLPDLSLKFHGNSFGIDLSSNLFEGPLPRFPPNTTSINLSQNKFSGDIWVLCNIKIKNLNFLHQSLYFLDLSNNSLSGAVPDCFGQWGGLSVLNLADNKFSGALPESIGSLLWLNTLDLHNNNFHGILPSALRHCTNLHFLDLSDNRFSGGLPCWIGQNLSYLVFISLKSNMISGNIPDEFCQLESLQILDLSANKISGTIPRCLNNLRAMVQVDNLNTTIGTSISASLSLVDYVNKAIIRWKGREYLYGSNLGLLRVIDFSRNYLFGEIPKEITMLVGLKALNLSSNRLEGLIPTDIGKLKQIESLDFSRNLLSGDIPRSISGLSFLSHLNLSSNNLSGEIPTSPQLQGLDASSFDGNPNLCGPPTQKKCHEENGYQSNSDDNDDKDDEFLKWVFAGIALGFGVGFWGICVVPMLKTSWRHSYLRFLDYLLYKLHVVGNSLRV